MKVRPPLAFRSTELQAKLFRGFADASRLAILEALVPGSRNVTQLVEATGLSQPNVSNHLACLRECGIVVGRQDGRFTTYRVADERVVRILALARDVLGDVQDEIAACLRYGEELERVDRSRRGSARKRGARAGRRRGDGGERRAGGV